MKNKINKFIHSKYLLISLIVLLILLVMATGTYAWFTWRSTNNTSLTMNIGKLADVTFNSGNDISTTSLAPVFNYTDGEKTTFSINNKDTTGASLDYNIKLNITSIASELKSSDLKYVLLKDNTIVKEGDFSTMVVGTNTIYSDSISSSGTINFTFYLYIDGNSENNLNMINKSLVGSIVVEAQETSFEIFADYIENTLYNNSTKTNVTNNGIKYQYDITNGLMKDADGNIRYSGLGDSNYVLFNCNTYPNTSCETWRIIGVFDGKVKLIRNESIGTYPWDNKDTTTGAEADYGSNDWTTARLMKLLNPGYTKESVNNSLYYNSKGGQCYAGVNNAETPCDFTYTGIKNDTTRNMIADAKWSLLGWLDEGVNVYADQSYKLENTSGTVYTGNKTSWTGKIALPYPSDYAYSAYLGKCTSTLGEYSNCSSWMKTMFNSKTIALLTPIVSSSFVFHVAGGCLDLGEPYAALDSEIFPTLYLNTNVSIKTGSGTLNSPYQLSVG